jgi:hypothetical protein
MQKSQIAGEVRTRHHGPIRKMGSLLCDLSPETWHAGAAQGAFC